MDPATTVMERCGLLGRISEDDDVLTRSYGSQAMEKVNWIVAGWMKDAGMAVRQDAIRNLIGRYEGNGEKTLVLGSHLDTVRDAGKYDGVLGVLVALACVQQLYDQGERLPFSIEVVAFADEEGLRFGTAFLGSLVYAGDFDPALLQIEDPKGVSLRDAVRDFGGESAVLEKSCRKSDDLLGYCEVHIEQGPVLEGRDLPIGVVTAINGQSRIKASFIGEAVHAGTVPMERRRDALCAAAEFVLAVEEAAGKEPGAVATVGEITTLPGASNVIPGQVHLSLDLRHPDDEVRKHLQGRIGGSAEKIAASRGCKLDWRIRHETPAVRMDPGLSGLLGEAVREAGKPVHRMPSGAGHDAAQMARLTPAALLFVRCEGGVSHNPAESVREEDVAEAIEVMTRFLTLMTATQSEETRERGAST